MLSVSVFIGYGGARAEQVADSLNNFLRSWMIDSFCASPSSNQIPLGVTTEQLRQIVRQKMEQCSIIVLVCHVESHDSAEFIDEIDYIIQHNLNKKVIVFSKCDHCIPDLATSLMHPNHFAPEKYEESFSRLLNTIFSTYVRSYGEFEIKKNTQGA